MKKFYAFAAAAIAALSMNAASIYVVGAGQGLSWDLPGLEVAANADGNYVLNIDGLTQFKFSTVSTTVWAEFDADGYQADGEFTDDVLKTGGQTIGLIPQSEPNPNIDMPWKGDYTITIKGDFSTVTAYTATPKPTEAPAVYLRGSMTGSDWPALPEWQFTYDANDGLYYLDCSLTTSDSFKIADADWGSINFGCSGLIVPSAEDQVWLDYNGADMALESDFEGTITFCYDGKENTYAIFAPADAGISGIVAEDNAPAVYYNLQGVRVANPESGLYIEVKAGKATKIIR